MAAHERPPKRRKEDGGRDVRHAERPSCIGESVSLRVCKRVQRQFTLKSPVFMHFSEKQHLTFNSTQCGYLYDIMAILFQVNERDITLYFHEHGHTLEDADEAWEPCGTNDEINGGQYLLVFENGIGQNLLPSVTNVLEPELNLIKIKGKTRDYVSDIPETPDVGVDSVPTTPTTARSMPPTPTTSKTRPPTPVAGRSSPQITVVLPNVASLTSTPRMSIPTTQKRSRRPIDSSTISTRDPPKKLVERTADTRELVRARDGGCVVTGIHPLLSICSHIIPHALLAVHPSVLAANLDRKIQSASENICFQMPIPRPYAFYCLQTLILFSIGFWPRFGNP